MGAAVNVDLT